MSTPAPISTSAPTRKKVTTLTLSPEKGTRRADHHADRLRLSHRHGSGSGRDRFHPGRRFAGDGRARLREHPARHHGRDAPSLPRRGTRRKERPC